MIIQKSRAVLDEDGRVLQFNQIEMESEGPNEPLSPIPRPTVLLEAPPSLPPQPTPTSVVRIEAGQAVWVEEGTLEQVRTWKWEQMKAARTAAELADFEFEGEMYQANKEQINGYVTMATIAVLFQQPFSQQWTLRDNSVQTLDANRMIRLGLALGNHVAGVYARGRALRAQIDDPEATPASVSDLTWD